MRGGVTGCTSGSEPEDLGSTPSPAASLRQVRTPRSMKIPTFTKNQWITISGSMVVLVVGVATIYFQHPTTSYAPQIMENSSGAVQVQGNGNTIVATPNREPITQYNILSTSEKIDDGLFHTKIEVLISFDKKGGLNISPKIYCEEFKDRERRTFQFEGGVYSGLVFNLDCKSSEPIQEGNNEYFKYINNK